MINNIIYFSHAINGPSGGAKIIYRHSEIINKLHNYNSEVVHLKKKRTAKWKISLKKRLNIKFTSESGWQFNQVEVAKNFKYNWFKNKIKSRSNLKFNKYKDFIILPEIFSHFAEEMLIRNNIKYGIFVQNGYAISSTNNERKLLSAYSNAKFILSYSDDITRCIKLKFPNLETKIIKTSYALNLNSKIKTKKNLITFMSRKLPQHSNLVVNFLKSHLPKNWIIKDIHQLSEKKTYEILNKSKIFLAFSHLEGLPLPPAEAALAKNYVIGYPGEGGNEYWNKPIFTKINSGEIKTFVEEIVKKVKFLNKYRKYPFKQLTSLKKKFSKKTERKNIQKFLNLVSK